MKTAFVKLTQYSKKSKHTWSKQQIENQRRNQNFTSMIMGKMLLEHANLFMLTVNWSLRFLTQTRPDVSSPEIYRVASPSQVQVGSTLGSLDDIASHSTQRHPLRTISVDSVLDLEEGRPLKRLRRRDESLAGDVFNVGYGSTSPRISKQPMNAFEQMRLAQEKQEKAAKKKLEKSEFVEAEAEESDDDDQFGFGGHKKLDDGEEEDGEDQDKTLEGLVDDETMDDETLAEDLVLEKVKCVVRIYSRYPREANPLSIGNTRRRMIKLLKKSTEMLSKAR
jgi:hypothetical protein